jgi:alkylation response protein AidB-like acyl-CoA dehydrogenase
MTPASQPEIEPLRHEVLNWLEQHWDADLSVAEWWQIVGRAGWTAPHFSAEHGGRGLYRTAGVTVRAAFADFGALRPPGGLGLLMAAPTILTHGTADQIARHVPPILEGRTNWCQLFSEPGSGSDLAGLTTRAERDGDRWTINGQKVWSSMARECDCGMLLARTDFAVPKHSGISWFAFKLDQPGVTIRPLREMTGDAVFNEVFFDNAEVDDIDLIGGAGNGWAVTQTTLYLERSGIGAGGAHAGFPVPGPLGGFLGRRAGDAARDREPGGDLVVHFADVARLAASQQRLNDPHVRQQLARLYSYSQMGRWNAQRAKAETRRSGGQAIANLGKLAQTRIVKTAASVATQILGADAMLNSRDGVEDGRFSAAFIFSPASSIYGGTDEIQRNIVAEKGLGLPKEVLPGKGEPYGAFLRSLDHPSG